MTVFDTVRPSLVTVRIPDDAVLGASDYQRGDVQQSKSLNGDLGGAYAPKTPIIFGGAGVEFNGGSQITGGLRTQTGGSIMVGTSASKPVELNARTRIIRASLADLQPDQLTLAKAGVSVRIEDCFKWFSSGVIVNSAPWGSAPTLLGLSIPSRYLHHGDTSQLLSVTTTFRFIERPPAPPAWTPSVIASMPSATLEGYTNTGTSAPVPQFLSGGSFAGAWAASHTYTVGQYIIPLANVEPPVSYFKATAVTGASGASEPNPWNLTPGSTTTDGGVTWTCIGGLGVAWAPTADAYYAGGKAQSVTQAFDPATNITLDATQYGYVLVLQNTDPNIIWHSVAFAFGNITSETFE